MIVSVFSAKGFKVRFAENFCTRVSLNLDQGLAVENTMYGVPENVMVLKYYYYHWALSVPGLHGHFYSQACSFVNTRAISTHSFALKCYPSESQVELLRKSAPSALLLCLTAPCSGSILLCSLWDSQVWGKDFFADWTSGCSVASFRIINKTAIV